MLLRRIIAHFRKQEWTAIFLDFLIVVAGILIAFQITDWNERRAEHAREGRYLAQIADDLRADLEEIEFVRGNAECRVSAAEAILARAGAPPRRWELTWAQDSYQLNAAAPFQSDDPFAANGALSILPTLDGNRHTYAALISTGEFRILRDETLARDIQSYYAEVDEVRDFGVTLEIVREAVAASRHRLGISNFAVVTLDQLAARVAADRELAAQLDTYRIFSAMHAVLMARLRARANALIERIETRT